MIQDPRVGITMYPGPPSPPGEKDGGQRRWDGASSDLPRKRAFCPAVVPSRHPGYGAKGLVHTPVPFAHRDVTPFSSHCLLTAVKVQVVLPAVPGLVLVGEAAVKRSSLVVLDFGLDVFCRQGPLPLGHRNRQEGEVTAASGPGPKLVEGLSEGSGALQDVVPSLSPGPSRSLAGPRLGESEGLYNKA